jgi:uncharacterized protein YndB with AHSA1/START domain
VISYSTQVTIGRSPASVLDALLDADRYSQWTEMVDASFDGVGSPRVGTRGAFRLPGGPLKGSYTMEIVDLQPDRRLIIRIEGAALTWISDTALEPEQGGTRMTYAGTIQLHGWRRAFEPFMRREAEEGEAKEAERFKRMLEADPVAA